MSHLVSLPVVIPFLVGPLMILIGRRNIAVQRGLSLVTVLATLLASAYLMSEVAGGEIFVYRIGDWQAPFGIVLVGDRLAAVMVTLTSLLAVFALLYSLKWADKRGRHFHFFFLLQLAGINGAFLTGDLFNLFVFFEVLLIASYNLLLHGQTLDRVEAGIHYVVINLTGSALFLIAIGTIYGVTGTLNMAHLGVRMSQLEASQVGLVRSGAMLLLVVFGIKGALIPLYFWLPKAYSAASAPVAAFFAVMTKIGVYAILRVSTLIFGFPSSAAAGITEPWLIPVALVTFVFGALGALGAERFNRTIAYLVIASVGTILAITGLFSREAIAAGLYYLVHSTIATAALFLLVDVIARQRGPSEDELHHGRQVHQPKLLAPIFFAAAVAMAGLPPLSGFLAKLMILDAALGSAEVAWIWGTVLAMGLVVVVTFARAGNVLFWKVESAEQTEYDSAFGVSMAVVGLLLCVVAMTVWAEPLYGYLLETASQLLEPSVYAEVIL